MKTAITLSIALLAATVQPAAADCVHNAFNTLVSMSENGTTIYDCDSAFTLMAVEPVPSNQTSLHARCTDPVTYSVKQTKIAQSGTWWDVWAHDSGCMYCGYSNGMCHESIAWTDTSYSSFSVGFDMSTQDTVLDLIKSNGGFNLGYSWGHSFTKSNTKVCDILPGDVSRLFVQNQKGWADSQTRYMTSTRGCGGNSVSYDPWSAYQHSKKTTQSICYSHAMVRVNGRSKYGIATFTFKLDLLRM